MDTKQPLKNCMEKNELEKYKFVSLSDLCSRIKDSWAQSHKTLGFKGAQLSQMKDL